MTCDRFCPQFESRETGLLVRAPAKINLSLLIAGRRPDGFHEIETVMAKIDWFDEVLIEPGPTGVVFACEGPHWAPADETNLVYRAADLLLQTCGKSPGVKLTLTKNVPAGSGLGSGSSDAAATLAGLNEYLNLGLSKAQLLALASQLGSDVPFFLNGPLAYCTGRGEKITELSGNFPFVALLILSDVNSSTKAVYGNYRHDPALYRQLHDTMGALLARNRVDSVARMCVNMLQRSCFELYEELGQRKAAIESLGLGPVCLSGSGSTMFIFVGPGDPGHLEALRELVAEKTGCASAVVRNNRW
jgi:4-diphosphocytidyl-2-C-methyl-D-erythritol kinase